MDFKVGNVLRVIRPYEALPYEYVILIKISDEWAYTKHFTQPHKSEAGHLYSRFEFAYATVGDMPKLTKAFNGIE